MEVFVFNSVIGIRMLILVMPGSGSVCSSKVSAEKQDVASHESHFKCMIHLIPEQTNTSQTGTRV